jgi:1-acyl-sn-glycerol-3-phosphate acyltransferase
MIQRFIAHDGRVNVLTFTGASLLSLLRYLLLTIHFVIASVIGLLIGLCRPFNPDNSRLCARVFAIPALLIMGFRMRIEADGLLKHKRPAVIVCNHLSNHDLFVIGQVVPRRTVSLGKTSLKWVPVFGQLYWLAGNILVDRGNAVQAKKAMETTTDTLQHKDMSLWVFAEGTRGHGKGLGAFKKGAFLMAVNAGVPIVPVCANNYTRTMNLNRKVGGVAVIRTLPPISTEGMTPDDVPALMQRCHADMAACIDQLDREAEALLRSGT